MKWYRRGIFLLAVFTCCILFCACKSQEAICGIPISSTRKTAVQLCKTVYTDEALQKIQEVWKERQGTLEDLNQLYPVEYLRLSRDDTFLNVCYRSKTQYLIFGFEKDGSYMFCDFSSILPYKCKELEKIPIGTPVKEVLEQYGGDYFYGALSYLPPNESYHRTSDGYEVIIHYDENSCVESIETLVY